MEALLSRKFLFAVLLVILDFVLVLIGKVTASEFSSFAMIVGGMYVVGNLGSGVIDTVRSLNQPTATITTTETPNKVITTGEIPTIDSKVVDRTE